MSVPKMSRRTLLMTSLAGAPLAITACAADAEVRRRDEPVLLETIQSELALIAAYDAALADDPANETWKTIRQQHQQHLDELQPLLVSRSLGDISPSPSSPSGLVLNLQDRERQAAAARAQAANRAENPNLVELICIIGASEAQHAAVLSR